jgi:hypothetical protein
MLRFVDGQFCCSRRCESEDLTAGIVEPVPANVPQTP